MRPTILFLVLALILTVLVMPSVHSASTTRHAGTGTVSHRTPPATSSHAQRTTSSSRRTSSPNSSRSTSKTSKPITARPTTSRPATTKRASSTAKPRPSARPKRLSQWDWA